MKTYQRLLQDICKNGMAHNDRTGVGTTSRFGAQFVHDMGKGFPLLTTKRVPFRWVAEELFWILRGDTFEPNLRAKGVDIWQEWATAEACQRFGRVEGDLGPVYGWQLRHFGVKYTPIFDYPGAGKGRAMYIHGKGHDQLWHLLYDLQKNPYSRRHVVSYWNPTQADEVALPPCHTLWQCKVEAPIHERECDADIEGRVEACDCNAKPMLHLELYMRSCDSFLGLPFNIASYALLLSLLAHTCNFTPGRLIISFGDVHIYNNHMAQVEEQLSRKPYGLPTLTVAEHLRGQGFAGLLSAEWPDLKLDGYKHWPKIEAEVAV